MTTVKYLSDHRKPIGISRLTKKKTILVSRANLATKVIIDRRTIAVHKFRTRVGFKQYDINLTEEQSVLTKRKSSLEGENMLTQCCVRLCFHEYRLSIYID